MEGRLVGILLLLLLVAPPVRAGRRLSGDEAEQWLRRARAHADLEACGAPAFRLGAVVDLPLAGSPGPEGTLVWTRLGPEQQHVELVIDGHRRVRVTRPDGIFEWSVPDELPSGLGLIMDVLLETLRPDERLQSHEGDRLQGFRQGSDRIRLALTSDESLARSVVLERRTARPVWFGADFSLDWGGSLPLGACRWPSRIQVSTDGRAVALLDFELAESGGGVELPEISPPERVLRIVDPEQDEAGIVRPKLLRRPRHRRPHSALARGLTGTVTVRVLVDARGRVAEAEIEQSLGPDVDAEALRVVRASRYRPATRDGEPVPVRLLVTLRF